MGFRMHPLKLSEFDYAGNGLFFHSLTTIMRNDQIFVLLYNFVTYVRMF